MRSLNKNNPILFIVPFIFLLMGQYAYSESSAKKVIGETANILVNEADLYYLSRIDTGARITSIHALDLQVENNSADKENNIGKDITFTTINQNNQKTKITTKIVDVAKVRNAQGVEYRYVVELVLTWQGIEKKGLVNLRDRSAMSYKLLIGRNWLSQDFVVDVDLSEGIIK